MLCLYRTTRQSIIIKGDGIEHEIEVKVLENDGELVKLGINAPKNISINRLEVEQRMQKKTDFRIVDHIMSEQRSCSFLK